MLSLKKSLLTPVCLPLMFALPVLPALAANPETVFAGLEDKVVEWRRDFHQHPELSNREFRTAKKIAAHLQSIGLKPQTGIAHTGVVALLDTGKPGPTVALRADMDALPVVEQTGLPFASTVKTQYNGLDVGVMHACGHDAHVAILMATAEALVKQKSTLKGKVLFIFQPAEEGAPSGEEGGAEMMLKEGLFKRYKPDVVFGLHVGPGPIGTATYYPGAAMAASDKFTVTVKGRQTHGSMPWFGVDPVTVAAQTVLGLQTIVSRQVNFMEAPAVLSVGSVHGGVRNNIVPDQIVMEGTLRTFSDNQQKDIHQRMKTTATNIAASAGATAEVDIDIGYPVLVNDVTLMDQALPSMKKILGDDNVMMGMRAFGSEDFSYFSREVPGFYFWLGVTPKGKNPMKEAPNHSSFFDIDEQSLMLGVRLFNQMTVDYLSK